MGGPGIGHVLGAPLGEANAVAEALAVEEHDGRAGLGTSRRQRDQGGRGDEQ
jgi:hypothetical protein